MTSNFDIEVDLKDQGNNNNNQIFLSPIENFPYFKEKNLFLSIEYYLCTGLSVFLLSYFTTSAGFISYSHILKKQLVSHDAYLSKYRDFYDFQWRFFRKNIFIFLIIAVAFVIMSKFIKKYFEKNIRMFNSITGILFCFYIMKFKTAYLLGASCCFYFTKSLIKLGEKAFIAICWIELILVKYLIKYFQRILDLNKFLNLSRENNIDNLSWEILLIYSLLKMLSFNLEYKKIYNNESTAESILNINQAKSHCMQCYDGNFCEKCLENAFICEKEKIEESFSFINLLNYIFYPPLLLGGPLINYNSFIFQQNIHKESEHNTLLKMNKIFYVLKLISLFVMMEVYNQFLYPIYLFKNKKDPIEPNNNISLFYYCFICLNILTFLWLKYSIIWKSFRFWAWCDGIFVEENMNRFIYNFYSLEELFRGLNRSLNRWMVRYIYIPLGGKNMKYINIWVVFGFWYLIYDFKNIDYGVFALCCCILMDLEMFVKSTFINNFGEDFNEKIYLRYGKYIVCSFYVFIMFFIGLFGFNLSLNNMKVIFDIVVEKGGLFYFLNLVLVILPNVVMMFFIRYMELENCVILHKKPLNY